ncbi:DotA/TraY family protein [Aureimonas ureilytica]|uniref:DotA/TraY family protein n=1 Tax=Aureimonas ureilytica TaxID=401562 RepID=UPI00037E9189|nr:DotA/TraY family protein [Aureimonas ureilytica]
MNRLPAALLFLLVSVATASAADIDIVDIFKGQGDPQTNEYLNMVFGPLFPVVGSSGAQTETLVSRLISNFNVIFFAIGLLLLVYNVIVGVTETAHDGSVLGQRHSSLWSPIRMIVAAACLIPLPTGYNGAQHAIAYVVNAGTATASFFWDETVEAIIQDKIPVASPDFASLDAQFLQAVWRMELCMAAYNQEMTGAAMMAEWTSNAGSDPKKNPLMLQYSLPTRAGACGKISLPPPPAGFDRVATAAGVNYGTWQEGMKSAVESTVQQFRSVAKEVARAASKREELPAPRKLGDDLHSWREQHRNVTGALVNTIDERSSKAASEELIKTGQEISDTRLAANMTNGGWTQAGFYYSIISRFTADSSAVQQMMPIAAPGDAIGASSNPNGQTFQAVRSQVSSWWFGNRDGDTREFLAEVVNTYNIAVNWWNESVARSNVQAFTNERQEFADTAGELAAWVPAPGGMFDAFSYLDPAEGYNKDPLLALMTVGQTLAVAAGVAITALALLAIGPFVGNAAVFVGTVLGWVLSGTAFIGMFISFVLPLVPTLIWVISIGAFLLLVVEAIFAGPLWAIAHLSMDRQGGPVGPGARRGYVMLLALFLTPVLMLFGFLAGMAIFRVLGTLINGGFYYAMTAAQSLSTDQYFGIMSIFGIFASLVMMVFLYLIIIERSFSLGAELPGRVLRWFDDVAVDLDDSSAARARVGAAAGTAALGGGMKAIGGQSQARIARRRDLRPKLPPPSPPPQPDKDGDDDS